MVSLGISEFTFGYAFLYEQTQQNWGDLRACPILPSLQAEKDAGWDAHLPVVGTDYYYQFKLSDYLWRGNATFIKDGTYAAPYYRLWLHRRDGNRQHQRLREHCTDNPNTYYVAPECFSIDQFNDAFLNHNITQRSRIIPVTECDDIDDDEQHCMTFQPGISGFILHSEPKRRERSYSGDEVEKLYRESHQQWKHLDRHFMDTLFHKTDSAVKRALEREEPWRMRADQARREIDFVPQQHTPTEVLTRTSELLSTFFGLTMVLVGTTAK
jgi:hypothetical protein